MPILISNRLEHAVRLSKGLPPLLVYNTRILWGRTNENRRYEKRK
jgi:hypothetical protein